MSTVFSPTPSQNFLRPADDAAGFDDRGREVGVLAERFGHDRGIGQDGRGAGDLDVVAGDGRARERRRRKRKRRDGGKKLGFHLMSP